jgi:anti-sigma factor RsiW
MATHHTADDDLEGYSRGRLSIEASAPLEEHLLVCTRCQERLARWDEYIPAIRAACNALHPPARVRTAGGSSPE